MALISERTTGAWSRGDLWACNAQHRGSGGWTWWQDEDLSMYVADEWSRTFDSLLDGTHYLASVLPVNDETVGDLADLLVGPYCHHCGEKVST